MKKISRLAVCAAFLAAIIVSFAAGSFMKEQEYLDRRAQRCNTLISFAIEKAEHEDLSDQAVRKALVSDVYAAYEVCDRPNLSERLHDLWNTLIFDGDSYIGEEDLLITELRNISDMIQL